jgi:hypothetical protein
MRPAAIARSNDPPAPPIRNYGFGQSKILGKRVSVKNIDHGDNRKNETK